MVEDVLKKRKHESHNINERDELNHASGPWFVTKPQAVKVTDDAREMLRADLENENRTIRAYRERVKQCEALGEYAIAEDIREILRQEQEHQTDLATALGEDVPDVSVSPSKPSKAKH